MSSLCNSRGSPAARISCVVSLGCGVYPPEPLGNTDIADALKIRKLHKIPARLRELLTLLTTAVCVVDGVEHVLLMQKLCCLCKNYVWGSLNQMQLLTC